MKKILSILLTITFLLSGIQTTTLVSAKESNVEKSKKSKKKILGYKVVSKDVPQFDEAPILITSKTKDNNINVYVGKVNGKYGAITDKQKVIVPFEYDEFYVPTNNFMKQKGKKVVVCNLFDSDGKNDEFKETDSVLNNHKWLGFTGAGDLLHFYIKNDNGNLLAYVRYSPYPGNGEEYYDGPVQGSDIRLEKRSNQIIVAHIEGDPNHYYLFNLLGDVFGPYDINESANYSISRIIESKKFIAKTIPEEIGMLEADCVLNESGAFYVRENEMYSIFSAGGIRKCDQVFDEAYPISYKSIKVKKDNKIGIVNENADLIFLDNFEDASDYLNNQFYAKKDGKWYLLELKDDPKPATYVVNDDVVNGVYLHSEPNKQDKSNRGDLLMPGDTAQITRVIENSDCKWGKTVEGKYVCIYEPIGQENESYGEYMSLMK